MVREWLNPKNRVEAAGSKPISVVRNIPNNKMPAEAERHCNKHIKNDANGLDDSVFLFKFNEKSQYIK